MENNSQTLTVRATVLKFEERWNETCSAKIDGAKQTKKKSEKKKQNHISG